MKVTPLNSSERSVYRYSAPYMNQGRHLLESLGHHTVSSSDLLLITVRIGLLQEIFLLFYLMMPFFGASNGQQFSVVFNPIGAQNASPASK
jgi:hypothetical protein